MVLPYGTGRGSAALTVGAVRRRMMREWEEEENTRRQKKAKAVSVAPACYTSYVTDRN